MSCARPARAANLRQRSCAPRVSAAWCTWTAAPTPGPSRDCPSRAARSAPDQLLGAEWTLLKPIRPGGPHSLTEVLTAVARKLQLSTPASSAPTSAWVPFASMVRRACQRPYPSDVVLATGSALVVDPQGRAFYSSRTTDKLAASLRNRRSSVGKVVDVPDTRKLAVRLARWGIRPRPLEELLWLKGLVTGAGESLGTWNPREPVRLKRWPNFASLPHRQCHLKMAAILTADAALAAALAEACEVAVGDAADFLNACAEIGILETRAAPVAASPPRKIR